MIIYFKKQPSGLFKLITEGSPEFLEYVYQITPASSDNDNIIGEILDIEDTASITTVSGSYIIFKLANVYNDWEMLSVSTTLTDLQNNVQEAIAHSAITDLKLVNCPVSIDFQPLPVTPSQATDSDMDYDNPSTQYLLVTPAQIKAMIDQAITESGGGGGRGIPVVPVTVDP